MSQASSSPITVRPAAPADQETIVAFNAEMALETEGLTLDAATLRAGVAAILGDPSRGFYLVAEQAGQPVGQLLITFEWSDWRNAYYWWIQSVYVAASHRRRGAYRALEAAARELALRRGDVCGLRLYVERGNRSAQQTYASLGMTQSHYDMWEVEFPSG